MFPFLICSSYFEVVISFKSFNLTGAIPPFNQLFNGVSFEWALTHRSFPRILPDSSNFPGAIPEFFSKFDVRMNFIGQMFSKINFKLFFIVDSTSSLFILPEYLNNFGVISRRHSQHLKTEVEFSLNLVHSPEDSWC